MALCKLRTSGGALARQLLLQRSPAAGSSSSSGSALGLPQLNKSNGLHLGQVCLVTADEFPKSTKEMGRHRDPDRFRRMLNLEEYNFTRDGFKVERTRPRHALGDFRTPHPGDYPGVVAPEEAEDLDEVDQLEYKFSLPNYETENFTFDAEHGILQEADDEKAFYENVVLPKTQNQAFRKMAQQIHPIDQAEEKGLSDFVTSRDPEEWSFVERLSPASQVIPHQFEYKEYPSGFVPPNPALRQDANLEYFVGRSRNNMLPVYTDHSRVKDTVDTTINHCEGNLYQLRDEMKAFLFERYEQEFASQVAELHGEIKFRGDFEYELKEFLLSKGF